ncbi:MAG TPA: hypothetical protein VK391_05400, partial [Allosphingosinicella sp.]|nr:hypothetical protein [Allosphingosinicella sp.]
YGHPFRFEEIPFPTAGGGSGAIADNSVTNTKLADMPDNTLKGRIAFGVGGDPVDVSLGTLATHMPRFTDGDNGSTQRRGVVGNEGVSNTTDFLRRDGVWAAPAGGGGSAGLINRFEKAIFTSNGGTLNVLVQSSGIASIVRTGVGRFTVTFTTPTDAYTVSMMASRDGSAIKNCGFDGNRAQSVTMEWMKLLVADDAGQAVDSELMTLMIFR